MQIHYIVEMMIYTVLFAHLCRNRQKLIMKVIWKDEKDHYLEQAEIASKLISNKQSLKKMKDAVIDVSLQRVWMRNEMFREPMTAAQIENFISRRQDRFA